MKTCTVCLALLCCLIEQSVTSQSFRFTSWPTTVCRYKDGPVTLTWLLSKPFGSSWFSVAVYYVKPVPVMVSVASNEQQPDGVKVQIQQGTEFSDASLRLRHGSNVVNLTLATVSPLHRLYGYQCIVRITTGDSFFSPEAWIVVCDTPTVPVFTSSAANPVIGTVFTLTCSANSTTRVSRHLPTNRNITMTYTWLRDGRRLPTDGRHVLSGAGNSSLTINPVQVKDDNKTYTCIAREAASELSNSNNITLDVRWPPHWSELHPDSRIAKAGVGGSCLFVVWITASPLPSPDRWRWKMQSGGATETVAVQFLAYGDVAILSINNVTSAHYGNYSIWTSNDYGGWNESDLVFTLLPEDEALNTTMSDGGSLPEPAKWYRLEPADTVREVPLGESAAFTVWIHARPLPREDEWSWEFASDASSNTSSTPPDGVRLLVTGPIARLLIANVTRSHYGTYSIWTRNRYGGWSEDDLKFTLQPEERVLFYKSFPSGKTREVREGESVSLVVWIDAGRLPDRDLWHWNFSSSDSRERRSADVAAEVEGLEEGPTDVYLTTAGDMAVLSILNVTTKHYGGYFVWIDDNHGREEREAAVMFVVKSAGLNRDASVADKDKLSSGTKAFAISAFLGFLSLVLLILLLVLVFRKKKFRQRHRRDYKKGSQDSAVAYSSNTTACSLEVDNNVQYSIHRHSSIADGHFYQVWQGKLCKDENDGDDDLQIAIKTAKVNNGIYTSYLQGQGRSLNQLRGNEYIVYCLGMVSDSLLLEYTPFGDLRQYLEATGHQTGAENKPAVQINLILQIIKGIKAVQQLDPPALFYCLCSSNVLVWSGTRCKLSGFAAAEAVRSRERWEEENQLSRPIRWLAPEAIQLNHIAASDVWSFGVLMWEIQSPAGAVPLGHMTNEEAREKIFCGQRPLKPAECPPEVYDVMTWCWLFEPRHRPSIHDVEEELMNLTRCGPV